MAGLAQSSKRLSQIQTTLAAWQIVAALYPYCLYSDVSTHNDKQVSSGSRRAGVASFIPFSSRVAIPNQQPNSCTPETTHTYLYQHPDVPDEMSHRKVSPSVVHPSRYRAFDDWMSDVSHKYVLICILRLCGPSKRYCTDWAGSYFEMFVRFQTGMTLLLLGSSSCLANLIERPSTTRFNGCCRRKYCSLYECMCE